MASRSLAVPALLLSAIGLLAGSAHAQPPKGVEPPRVDPPAPPPAKVEPPAPPPAKAEPPAAPPPPKAAPPKRPRLPPPPPPPGDSLPEPEVEARIIAPSAEGPWIFRIDNEGGRVVRVPADVRLLHLSITDPNKPSAKPVACTLPKSLLPDAEAHRALLLSPGESYVETFDPRLFCFGAKASPLVAGNAVVEGSFGFGQTGPGPRRPVKPGGPYAVEGTDSPADLAPLKMLPVPTIMLSHRAPEPEEEPLPPPIPVDPNAKDKGEKPRDKYERSYRDNLPRHGDRTRIGPARPEEKPPEPPPEPKDQKPEPPPPIDESAARFQLSPPTFLDVGDANNVSLSITATNVGKKPTMAVVRPRMLAFKVQGPDGLVRCEAPGPSRSISREMFRTYAPGASTAMTVYVSEACGRDVFRRPGLYRVSVSMSLVESGSELGLQAFTGVAESKHTTLVRVASAREPYHKHSPKGAKAPSDDGSILPPP